MSENLADGTMDPGFKPDHNSNCCDRSLDPIKNLNTVIKHDLDISKYKTNPNPEPGFKLNFSLGLQATTT